MRVSLKQFRKENDRWLKLVRRDIGSAYGGSVRGPYWLLELRLPEYELVLKFAKSGHINAAHNILEVELRKHYRTPLLRRLVAS